MSGRWYFDIGPIYCMGCGEETIFTDDGMFCGCPMSNTEEPARFLREWEKFWKEGTA